MATAKPRPQTPPPPPPPGARIKDSVFEKAAALRSASGGLQLEQEDERWGIEAAKERKRRSEAARAAQSGSGAAPTRTPTGPVDIRAP